MAFDFFSIHSFMKPYPDTSTIRWALNALMKLTRSQLIKLKVYSEYRTSPPTLAGFFKRSWRTFILVLLATLVGLFFALTDSPGFGWGLIGYVMGALSITILMAGASAADWALVQHILDWDRVTQLISDSEKKDVQPDA